MAEMADFCHKIKTMVDNNYKFQKSPEVQQRPISGFKQAPSLEDKRVSLKQGILPIGTLLFLGTWIGFCVYYNGYMLDKALLCSAIIVCFLFFRTAEQNGDWRNKN